MASFRNIYTSLMLVIAGSTSKELARQVSYLKAENQILRSRLPERLILTHREKNRLVRFAKNLGSALNELATIVHPSTIRRWIRDASDKVAKTRKNVGRPRTAEQIEKLILKLAKDNSWGYTRILGELKKLGIESVTRNTVKNILKRNGYDVGPKRGPGTWDEFIKRHAKTMWQCDFYSKKVVSKTGLRDLFVLVFLHLETRRVFITPASYHPDEAWVLEQAEAFKQHVKEEKLSCKLLMHDRDTKFTKSFDEAFSAGKRDVKVSAFRSPNTNAYVERFIQTLQQECLDHFVVFGKTHFDHLCSEYREHYHMERPHQSLENLVLPTAKAKRTNKPKKQSPAPETISLSSINCKERLGGLLKHYPRNPDLDPQLVWRGKDEQDWSDLVVHAPPLYIQEKVHPKVLIDELLRQTEKTKWESEGSKLVQLDLFSDFNGVPEGDAKTEFYQHDQNWSNRMILGDSLQVMASLAEREGLRGKVQCIYFDPPYGIKFNSNFQWSTTSRDVKDGNATHITREPEQVKAFRDTWRDGIHSYLTYLRDRLTVARDLLTDSGSIFVQIGDENLHHVRELMDEVFGPTNFASLISFGKGAGLGSNLLTGVNDYLLWYAKDISNVKYRQVYQSKTFAEGGGRYNQIMLADRTVRPATKSEKEDGIPLETDAMLFMNDNLTKPGPGSRFPINLHGRNFRPEPRWWGTTEEGIARAIKAERVAITGNSLSYRRFLTDFTIYPITNSWTRIGGVMSRSDPKVYVVQTSTAAIERCVLMTSDPGDLVLDPTCGSGTTAYAAEQWGRRWITIDTSRVALALARARIMGARAP